MAVTISKKGALHAWQLYQRKAGVLGGATRHMVIFVKGATRSRFLAGFRLLRLNGSRLGLGLGLHLLLHEGHLQLHEGRNAGADELCRNEGVGFEASLIEVGAGGTNATQPGKGIDNALREGVGLAVGALHFIGQGLADGGGVEEEEEVGLWGDFFGSLQDGGVLAQGGGGLFLSELNGLVAGLL